MKHTYLVLILMLLVLQRNSYSMEGATANNLSEYKAHVWSKIQRTIEAQARAKNEKLSMFKLDATTVNQTIIINERKPVIVLYLLVTYALNTLHTHRVEHHLDFVKFALNNGANINQFAGHETTLMFLARFASKQDPTSLDYKSDERIMDTLNLLLTYKPTLDLQHEEHGETALLMAIGPVGNKRTLQVTNALLQAKANPNIRNKDGQTALVRAAQNGNFDLIELLIDNNAIFNPELNNALPDTTKLYLSIISELKQIDTMLTHVNQMIESLTARRQLEREMQRETQRIEHHLDSALNRSIQHNEAARRLHRQPSDD